LAPYVLTKIETSLAILLRSALERLAFSFLESSSPHLGFLLYFLIFSYSVAQSIEIDMSLAGGVPVEDLSQGYPEADWDTELGDMLVESWGGIKFTVSQIL
jgi:hypothetical protein